MEKNTLKIEEIGFNNIPDILVPNWNKKKIKSLNNQEFDGIFNIENIPLSWFYKRMLSIHTIPPQFQTKHLIQQHIDGQKIQFNKSLDRKQKKFQKIFKWNELIKKKSCYGKIKMQPEKKGILFLTYLDHVNQKGELFRLNNLLKVLEKDERLNPFSILINPISNKFYRNFKKHWRCDNQFYLFINKEIKQKARDIAIDLSEKWKTIPEVEKIDLFNNNNLWNCIQYPFNFYFSKPFLYYLAICYFTYQKIITENNIKTIIITSQHNLHERCLNAIASIKKIPTILIQHGAGIGPLNPELLPPFKIAVFSKYYQDLLIKQNVDKKNINITGPITFDKIYPFLMRNKIKNTIPKILILTVPFIEQGFLKKREYFDYIKKTILELQTISCQIIIKLHPREKTLKEYFKKKKSNKWLNVEILQNTDSAYLYNLINGADIIINFSSTTALEAMILDKPVVTVIFDNFKNQLNDLLKKSKATREVNSMEDISVTVRELCVKDNLHHSRKLFIKKLCGIIDGKSSERMAKIILKILK